MLKLVSSGVSSHIVSHVSRASGRRRRWDVGWDRKGEIILRLDAMLHIDHSSQSIPLQSCIYSGARSVSD